MGGAGDTPDKPSSAPRLHNKPTHASLQSGACDADRVGGVKRKERRPCPFSEESASLPSDRSAVCLSSVQHNRCSVPFTLFLFVSLAVISSLLTERVCWRNEPRSGPMSQPRAARRSRISFAVRSVRCDAMRVADAFDPAVTCGCTHWWRMRGEERRGQSANWHCRPADPAATNRNPSSRHRFFTPPRPASSVDAFGRCNTKRRRRQGGANSLTARHPSFHRHGSTHSDSRAQKQQQQPQCSRSSLLIRPDRYCRLNPFWQPRAIDE